MKNIIEPVPANLLEQELTSDKFVRKTNYGDNKIYIFDQHSAPNLMREVGRLREYTFRSAGGGTGKALDIDKFDVAKIPYQQLIVWEPRDKKIVGGYRYFICNQAEKDENGEYILATSRLFKFSEKFKNEYLPYMIELGRSFVQPEYQSKNNPRQGIFALDNLWDGLGALTVNHPQIRYFFGKVTMYPNFDKKARNMILYFMDIYFNDDEKLVELLKPIDLEFDHQELSAIFDGKNYHKDYKTLLRKVRERGESLPPLINAYMNLSPTMKVFGTSINPHFGNVEETAIMISIKDINSTKIERHVASYEKS